MTRNEAVKAAKAAGYTRINTAAGPVQLEEWTPYGATKLDERTVGNVAFEFIDDPTHPRIEDVRLPAGSTFDFGLGIWLLGQE